MSAWDRETPSTWPSLQVEQIGPRRWRLLQQFMWQDVTVPRGFLTDAASVPRLFWWWTRPEGIFPAAIIHDMRYQFCGKKGALLRKEADEELRVNVLALGYRRSKARAIWFGPRWFSHRTWDRYFEASAVKET